MKHEVNSRFMFKGIIIGCVFGVFGTGCVAQKADLQKIHKDLDQQITQIRVEKKELTKELDAARAAIAESKQLILAQKADMNKMRGDLAPLHQKVELIAEQDLTRLYGQLEEAEKKTSDLKKDFQAHKKVFSITTGTLQSDLQSIQATVESHGEQLQTTQVQTTTLAQQIDENNQAVNQQLTDFQVAFRQFKMALTDIGTELTTETHRASSAEAQLSADVSTHVEQISADLANQQQAFQSVSDNLSQSLLELKETVAQSGILLSTQLDEQATRQAELAQQIASLSQQTTSLDQQATSLNQEIASLQGKLETDTQALRTFLEKDVNVAIDKLSIDIDNRQRPILQRINALQSDVEALGIHMQADATQVQELSQSVVQLREAQGVMGSLLGSRGDEIIQQAGRLSERIRTIESHQTTLTQQLESNTKKTSTHLTEVNASLTALSQSLDQTVGSLSQRLKQQEQAVATLNTTNQQFQQLKDATHDQIQQMHAASQLTHQLRETVEQINTRQQDLEIHQSELVGKLGSDAQATTTHLQEVNNGIQSVAQALENVSEKLNTRIVNQERQLNRAMTSFQNVQNSIEISQANVQHLNDLTGTMNQLQDVITTIGTKLGERVDEHEDRLGQLAQRVNRLQGTKSKK